MAVYSTQVDENNTSFSCIQCSFRGLLLRRCLLLPHGVVPAPGGQQLGMCASLDNFTSMKHQNLV